MPGVAGESFAWARPAAVDRASPPAELLAFLTGSGVRVAFGEPTDDLPGFVSSRRQAEAARRVARHLPHRPLIPYGDVALLQLLVADPVAASAFVRAELGRLIEEPSSDLRETTRRYLELGQDATATATALGVHRNTVMRRLDRAERLVGHPLSVRSTELLAGLLLSDVRLGHLDRRLQMVVGADRLGLRSVRLRQSRYCLGCVEGDEWGDGRQGLCQAIAALQVAAQRVVHASV